MPAGPMAPLTALVGREEELAQVRRLLVEREFRLLTLTGPGGVGKTHLALQLAHDVQGDFPAGVAMASLAPVHDPDLVVPTLAQAVGVGEGAGPLLERVGERLSGKRFLLILDNFEHLLAAAPLVTRLLAVCPGLTVLATSRAALRLTGERVVPVDPLPVPAGAVARNGETLWRNAAVRLFVARARSAGAAIPESDANAIAIHGICRRLDGLPLAIELAAARSLPPPGTGPRPSGR